MCADSANVNVRPVPGRSGWDQAGNRNLSLNNRRPVNEIVEQSKTGSVTSLISGIAVGFEGCQRHYDDHVGTTIRGVVRDDDRRPGLSGFAAHTRVKFHPPDRASKGIRRGHRPSVPRSTRQPRRVDFHQRPWRHPARRATEGTTCGRTKSEMKREMFPGPILACKQRRPAQSPSWARDQPQRHASRGPAPTRSHFRRAAVCDKVVLSACMQR